MSGHNKWSKIKNKKGNEDARRGKIFTKHARNITVAARQGGDNPDYNPALKQAIDKAKADNMPNDNIDRAIKKATGEGAGDNFQRVIYEGYGPAGVAVIVDCLTDNVQRTAPDVRHAFDKNGGNLGTDGSVMFMFDHKGEILVNNKDKDFDEFMMDALEAGADDVIEEDEFFEAITSVEAFNEAVAKLEESGYKIERSEISYIPQNEVEVSSEHHPSLTKLIDTLEDNDDVQEVYTNWDEPSEEE
ncbi:MULTISPECIES: YebC/PmpR family DNA-binding transcriptional regulator [Anaerococcus]|uniref:Probable transcriptional regulatory protein DXA39_03440 n=2 Tax=Anaerococcus TaxID=165779 RepID=A0A3E2TJU0_9FIRM|nr:MULTISPECIES: YebC/PmpR family DNA-binding transcriptional regulator [Anaerococcus]MBP2069409.1 YebC/PmpR family DNA-binding regulatory protein [Anaerococcus nagyae]MDU1829202.1 YebC/PmpR family DNA-binding transcriptional regulator [Anaerococcus sp.]MDU1864272.1 YebC/PmpR family DNA-binding transcriptional regulator [Anaerococcus sp.]MDU2565819.1 YebC/PmpR family DNA-binding transcriptional regulator [Anaerococcus sp.]MDU3211566.1 YebC/PmpR family DNA-binding transcriptional regulator [Ana